MRVGPYVYTIDSISKDALLENGCKVVAERKDLCGQTVWTLSTRGRTINLMEEPYRGKCLLSNVCTLVFNPKKKAGER